MVLLWLFLIASTHPLAATLNIHSHADEVLDYVRQFLPSDPVIVEAGGHWGEDTERLKRIWPQATLHVFEPLPDSYKILVEHTKHLSDVFCYPFALGDFVGETDFYINEENSGASSIGSPLAKGEMWREKPIRVPITTLAKWQADCQISHVDFMWLDMEGFELFALRNSGDLLSSVSAIYTEVNYQRTRTVCGVFPLLHLFLSMQGFRQVWCTDPNIFGDALYVKTNSLKRK